MKAYPTIAAELGNVDTANEAPVDFDITSKKIPGGLFQMCASSGRGKKVDFWWIDWQQGNTTKLPGLDPYGC